MSVPLKTRAPDAEVPEWVRKLREMSPEDRKRLRQSAIQRSREVKVNHHDEHLVPGPVFLEPVALWEEDD